MSGDVLAGIACNATADPAHLLSENAQLLCCIRMSIIYIYIIYIYTYILFSLYVFADKPGRLSLWRLARSVHACREPPDIQKMSVAFKLKPNAVQSRLQVSGVSSKSCEVAEDDSTWSNLPQAKLCGIVWRKRDSQFQHRLIDTPRSLKLPFACFSFPKSHCLVTRLGMLLPSPGQSGAPAGKRRCKKDGKS